MSELAEAQIVGHGIDIVETTRIQELIKRSGEQFEMECFTAKERSTSALGAKRIEYLAGRFAAKEAVIKALGAESNQGISWLHIEIQRLPSGEPSVVLHGKCKEIAEKLGITKWLLSISHTSSYAAASAIALSRNSVMMNHPVGIRSLAVSFPSLIRTNDYWIEKSPDLVAHNKPRRVRLPRPAEPSDNSGLNIWSQEVAPYLPDSFRGSVERRVLAPDESALTLEYRAAKDALDAAQLSPDEVELVIVASLFPEHIGPGSAAYLAHKLELRCPAWNLESTCSSAIIALQNACALVRSGEYRNVLVVVSHIGSNSVDEEDTLSWSIGDGAGAFVVDSLQPNQGILGIKIVPTAATCGAYSYELVTDAQGKPRMRTRTGENASMLAETAVDFVRTCCEGAAAAAGVTLDQIDFFAFNTPTAWYASVCTRALGIDPERTINLYPRYANIGPVFAIANLYHAAQLGKIRENDLVLVYTNGAAATAAATVMRWGDVTLGSVPAPPLGVTQAEERIHLTRTGFLSPETLVAVTTSSLSREQLLATELGKRRQMLETYLIEFLARSLQLPKDQLNSQQSLATWLDSLMALLLRSRIETDLQMRVPMEKFFGETTVAQLAELLLNQLALANLIASDVVADANEENEREILSF